MRAVAYSCADTCICTLGISTVHLFSALGVQDLNAKRVAANVSQAAGRESVNL